MSTEPAKPLLTVENLATYFPVRQGVFSRVSAHVRALDGVSFSIPRGTTMSLVGESGSGKTTCGRSLLRLIEPTGGRVVFDGIDVTELPKGELRSLRKRIQLIFQDPFSSLNPRMTVQGMLGEVLRVHKIVPRAERQHRIEELLGLVGLPPEAATRYPHEFSGGQRQRIGVARALAAEPDLIVADEPVSALDVSIQAQILNLLEDLQQRLGLTYLFIGHDLSVIRHISDTVGVMYLGKIVEMGAVEDIFARPTHPYTKALLSAVPIPDPDDDRRRIVLTGDVPSPINPPSGCPFHPRCPEAREECKEVLQTLQPIAEGHAAACHVNAPGA